MPAKYKKKPSNKGLKTVSFSKKTLVIFAIIFAGIGGYAIYKTFAAPPEATPPVIDSFYGTPNPFAYGGASINLVWKITSYADGYCDYTSPYSSNRINYLAGEGRVTASGTFTATGSFTANTTCFNAKGQTSSSTSVSMEGAPPPSISQFYATPTKVNKGSSVDLHWAVSNATYCGASGDAPWSGEKAATSGAQTVGPLTSVKTYTFYLSCANPNSSVHPTSPPAQVVVVDPGNPPPPGGGGGPPPGGGTTPPPSGGGSTAKPKPTVSLKPTQTSVAYNGSTYLQWNSTNADANSCTASWTNSKSTSGIQKIGPLTTTKTYSITCKNSAGSATSNSVKITVGAKPAGCTTNCPVPPTPAPPTTELEAPPPDTTIVENDESQQPSLPTESKSNSNKHLLSLLLGGLLGELINVVKHSGK